MTNTFDDLRPIPYAARRQHFLNELARRAENSIAIVPAHPELYRNNDVHFKFRQESNFRYLTGFDEPESIAVFRTVGGKKEFILFVRPKNLEMEIWTGFRAGTEGALSAFKADKAYPIDEFDSRMAELLQGVDRMYFGFFRTLLKNGVEYLDTKVMRLLDHHRQSLGRTGRGLVPIYDVNEILGEMRIYKAPEEVERMRKAAEISAKAHTEAMARCKPGVNEFQIEALVEYVSRNLGSERYGYPSIVATGANATILHYVENNKPLKDGDLLLIDAGTECDFYTADITRTFPVNAKFTKEQREIYDIVLKVQKECIQRTKPGVTIASLHEFTVDALTDAMIALKFLSGDKRKLIDSLAYKRYFPHGLGHLLGMDVHDIGLYQIDGAPRKLEPGMAFTIEPGFYILEQDTNVPPKYRGIGVRIEDDVVVTQNGCDVLTTGVPKEADEMCAIIGTKPWLDI